LATVNISALVFKKLFFSLRRRMTIWNTVGSVWMIQ